MNALIDTFEQRFINNWHHYHYALIKVLIKRYSKGVDKGSIFSFAGEAYIAGVCVVFCGVVIIFPLC